LIAGATTIETSQNAGSPGMGGEAWGRAGVGTNPAGSGGWKVPPGKDFAVIEITWGSDRLPKLSQVAAAETVGAAAPNRIAEHESSLNRLMTSSLILSYVCTCASLPGGDGQSADAAVLEKDDHHCRARVGLVLPIS